MREGGNEGREGEGGGKELGRNGKTIAWSKEGRGGGR